jgi:alpha-glucosidase
MRELKVPCDAIYLDIDYMDGFRCFTWDKEKFPDPKGMVDKLRADGFQTMVMIDPGIKKDKNYSVFQEGLEKGYFCKRIDGHYVEGKVWPGDCYFPDFTRKEVREWWATLYKEIIEDVGVAGVWNDMNEPALFEVESKTFPLDVIHDYDGHPTGHRKAHNVYGMQMARATAAGVKKYRNGQRTLIITRSGYSGLQRYSSVWTGDNIATFEHLWLADVQAQRLAISGVSFCGSDIGGFISQPKPELMMRWIQLGIFHPFCRVHSSGDHGEQEPWSFGEECLDVFRKFVELRYKLLPYIYTTFYQYHKEYTPMMRPLSFVDQDDKETVYRDHEFLCGDHILVCPVLEESARTKRVYLPSSEWYNLWTNKKYTGRKEYEIEAPIDEMPIFIKEGAIIPKYPVQQYVGEKTIETVTLDIYFKEGEETSYFYDDDKNGYGYEDNEYHYSKFLLSGSSNQIEITQSREGSFDAELKQFSLNIIGQPFDVESIQVDGKTFDVGTSIPSGFNKIKISLKV